MSYILNHVTFRCLPSQKVMTYFTRFARETTKEYNFIAVACNTNGTTGTERKDLIHHITGNGWREDGSVWHATSQCASSVYEATNHIWKNTTGGTIHLHHSINYSHMNMCLCNDKLNHKELPIKHNG